MSPFSYCPEARTVDNRAAARNVWFFDGATLGAGTAGRWKINLSPLLRSKAGGTDYPRWVNIKRGRARVGADEIEILAKMFPSYRWWLLTGEVQPGNGQTSPDYDEANRNLANPNAG